MQTNFKLYKDKGDRMLPDDMGGELDCQPNINMDEAAYRNHEGTTINHFYEKLLLMKDMMNTDCAKVIAKKRHEYMYEFLKEFYDEWNEQ